MLILIGAIGLMLLKLTRAQCFPPVIDDPICTCLIFGSQYDIRCESRIDDANKTRMPILSLKRGETVSSLEIRLKDFSQLTELGFNSSYKINELYLLYDNMNFIPKNMFANVSNLKVLSLVGNRLKIIERGVYNYLTKLETILFNENRIEWIEVGAFDGMGRLNDLEIRKNNISLLQDFVFANLSTLEILGLSGNHLTKLGDDTLTGVPNLDILDVSYNDLYEIEPNALNRIDQISSLNIQFNELTYLDEFTFDGLYNLRSLNIGNNKIDTLYSRSITSILAEELDLSYQNLESIEEDAVLSCPFLTRINFEHNQLKQLDRGFIRNLIRLETLALSDNLLTRIVFDNFGTQNQLKFLDLSNNEITVLEEGAFMNLKNLQELKLTNNDIRDLNMDSFKNLFSLKRLYLEKNKLLMIKTNTFRHLVNLEDLLLSDNFIISIDDFSFVGLDVLETLALSLNKLSTIGRNSFKGLKQVFRLYLDQNQIETIEPGTFSDLTRMTNLDLKRNQLTSLYSRVFEGAVNLNSLDLEYNKINRINGSFQSLKNLKELSLSNNNLNIIDDKTFSGLENLERLLLSNNQLGSFEQINQRYFDTFINLKSLTLDNIGADPFEIFNLTMYPGLVELDLSNNEFSLTDTSFPPKMNLEYFRLHNVNLTNLDHLHLNRMTKLNRLDLSMNPIDWSNINATRAVFQVNLDLASLILSNTFLDDMDKIGLSKLRYLKWLDLSYNRIEFINENTFRYNSPNCFQRGNLKYLNFRNNYLKSIAPTSFQCLSLIESLYLNENGLLSSNVSDNINYSLMRSVKTLEMSKTNLSKFPLFDKFYSLGYQLTRLVLSENRIEELTGLSFRYLEKLEYLDLQSNRIKTISSPNIFAGAPKLEFVHLGDNLIDDQNLKMIEFGVLTNLKSVNLSRNCITTVNSYLFSGLNKLESIDLGHNQIINIQPFSFNSLSNLKSLYLINLSESWVKLGENFLSNCGSLKFIHLSSIEIVKSNVDVIIRNLKAPPFDRTVNEVAYFNSINIIINNFEYYKSQTNLACKLTIFLIRYRIHLTLFSDFDFDVFIQNCYQIYLEDLELL